jgi:hypothetical protein
MEKRLETKQMKLTKQILKRIIKEELQTVLSESMIKPVPGGSITPEQQGGIDDLIYTQKPEFIKQARQLVDIMGGSPTYVDDVLEMIAQGIIPLAHSHEDVVDSFPSYDEATEQDNLDFYNATIGQDSEAASAVDKYSLSPSQRKAAQDMYRRTSNARRAARSAADGRK